MSKFEMSRGESTGVGYFIRFERLIRCLRWDHVGGLWFCHEDDVRRLL